MQVVRNTIHSISSNRGTVIGTPLESVEKTEDNGLDNGLDNGQFIVDLKAVSKAVSKPVSNPVSKPLSIFYKVTFLRRLVIVNRSFTCLFILD